MCSLVVKDLGEFYTQMERLTAFVAPTPTPPKLSGCVGNPKCVLATPNHAGSWQKATDSQISLTALCLSRVDSPLASACFGCLSLAFKLCGACGFQILSFVPARRFI